MSRTAAQEHFGCSVAMNIALNTALPLPFGPGGVRLFLLRPSVADLRVRLQDATLLQPGGAAQYVICNDGAHTLTVTDYDDNAVATVAVGSSVECILGDNPDAAGTWLPRLFPFALGTPLVYDRVPCELVLANTVRNGVGLRTLARSLGYTANVAYAVRVTVRTGVVIGNEVTTPAINTEEWPAGTTMMLVVEPGARVCGRGGDGGRGGDVPPGLLSQDGRDGGPAIRTYLDIAIHSHGAIQGGGGGGGGAIWLSTTPGGGGGGGAGYSESAGGASGNHAIPGNPPYPNGGGQPGTIDLPGAGGFTPAGTGGAGGGPGAAGSAGAGPGGAGGDPGAAVEYLTGVTVTWLETGTVDGAEVAF